jgi:ferric-dicitrate binding protein FerR (iron transport regulator)
MIDENILDLLARYINDESSEKDDQDVIKWLNSDPKNAKILQEFKEIWQISKGVQFNFQPDKESAWKKINKRIKNAEKQPEKVTISKPRLISLRILKIAAILVIGISLFTLYRQFFTIKDVDQIQVASAFDNVRVIDLPDGSKVWLNSQSKLEHPKNFSENVREVSLTGEAYFEVVKDPEKSFIIKGCKTEVKVLGTSFIYRSFPSESSDQVIVKTGIVAFSEKENSNNSITVESGFRSDFDSRTATLSKIKNESENYFALKTHRLIFENERFEKIISDLSRYYNQKFILEDTRLNDIRLTVAFDNQPVKEALKILELALDKRFIDSSQVIIVR